MVEIRPNSISVTGGAFGDEGKGRVVDEVCNRLVKRFSEVIVYRWNGGSNAGHTVELQDKKVVLHQIPSGALVDGATCVLGRGMVIHPGDFAEELSLISGTVKVQPKILVDEMTPLALDTHRAFESVLKKHEKGGAGSTGRGISPAYADVILRHPLRARDLLVPDWEEKFGKHYSFYRGLIDGLGEDLSKTRIATFSGEKVEVGSKKQFIKNLSIQREVIADHIESVYDFILDNWDSKIPFVFEGAQGVGLDHRWGVYPDVTASDPTPQGIFSSTEGIVDPKTIEIKANVYKATYTSSVGKRVLPTKMNDKLAERIREDAGEYGATTKRARDIYHIDIPMLKYFSRVSNATHMVLTHMDISYPEVPIKVCTKYYRFGFETDYRPDQEHLDGITPDYRNFKSWDGAGIKNLTDYAALPPQAKKFLNYLSEALGLIPLMLTTGPKRDAVIDINYLLL